MKYILQSALIVLLCLPQVKGQQFLPDDDPRVQTTMRVYDHLVRAIQMTAPAPQLLMYHGTMYVAASTSSNQIIIDSDLFEITKRCGTDSLNALACILGHELQHVIGRDHLTREVRDAPGMNNTEVQAIYDELDPHRNLDHRRLIESRADLIGAYYAYLAGYDPRPAGRKILRIIYDTYAVDSSGYPPLLDRAKLIDMQYRKLSSLLPLFETGVRMMISDHIEEAVVVFTRLLEEFPVRELYNNRGLCRLWLALAKDQEFRYALPSMTDTKLRVFSKTMGSVNGNQDRADYLRLAISDFQEAVRRDTSYLPARLNLACAELVLHRGENQPLIEGIMLQVRKEFVLRGAEEYLRSATILHAITLAIGNEAEDAITLLEEVLNDDPDNLWAIRNLRIIDASRTPVSLDKCGEKRPDYRVRERIAAFRSGGTIRFEPSNIPPFYGSIWSHMGTREATAVRFRNLGKRSDLFLVWGRPGYDGETSGGISVGSTSQDVVDAYGCPPYSWRSTTGIWHVFPAHRMAFHVSAADHVTEWMIWWKKD